MELNLFKSKITLFLLVVLSLYSVGLGYSQETEIAKYPNRPITYIMPFPAGVTGDLAMRLISKEAEKYLGQSITVLNKPGGVVLLGPQPSLLPNRMDIQ